MGLTGDLTVAEARGLGDELLAEIVETTRLSRQLVLRRLEGGQKNARIRSVFVNEWPDLAGELNRQTVASARANDLAGMIAHVTTLGPRTVQLVLDQTSGRSHVPNAFEFAWPGKVDSEERGDWLREYLSNQTVATIRQYDLFAELASALGREEGDVRRVLSAHRGHKLLRNIPADAGNVTAPLSPDEHDSEPDDEDERTLLSSTPNDGTAIGNGSLRDKLGWDEDRYFSVRARLISKGSIWLGKGRGGSVVLASGWRESRKRELLALVPADGAAVSNLTLIRRLEWDEADYEEIKQELVGAELLHVGKGRGGSVFRPQSLASSMPLVVTSTAGRAKVTSSVTLSAAPSVGSQRRTEPRTARAVAAPSPPAFNRVVPASPGAGPAVRPSPTVAPGGFYFPPPLLEAYRQNKLAVLFGSGLSLAKDTGGLIPGWKELPERLLQQALAHGVMTPSIVENHRAGLKIESDSLSVMLAKLDNFRIALEDGRKYQQALSAIFCPDDAVSGDAHRALVDLGVEVLVTTNYDELLEHAEPRRAVYTWKDADSAFARIKQGRKVLFKVHGTAGIARTVVMTRREYDAVAQDGGYQTVMRRLLQSYTFLLIGFSLNDPWDLDVVLRMNASNLGSEADAHYALMVKRESEPHIDRWQRELNVKVLPYDDHAQLPDILRALRGHKP